MSINKKPFDQKFVLDITTKHALTAIDLSIAKTFDRISEFENDPAKSLEVYATLTQLHSMKKLIETFKPTLTIRA